MFERRENEDKLSRKIYIETYGCQMNLNDTEIVSGILLDSGGYEMTDSPDNADIIFLNTCSVRENAEKTIFKRINNLRQYIRKDGKKLIGILGCMAERLQDKLVSDESMVSLVIGPDEYRKAPYLIERALEGQKGIAVELSTVETYEDVIPVRNDGISAWVSIMRGCNNFCSYCVVPYTRGRERSRSAETILSEISELKNKNIKEITLLGQNVNSYNDEESTFDFPGLLSECALAAPGIRFRFTTSHPKDMSDKLIEVMAEHDNICNHIHLPVQSGSDKILKAMNRRYTVEHYLERIVKIREYLPDASLTTDIIAGYPGESDEDHRATLDILRGVRYDGAFMFKYSPREGTKAYKLDDNVPDEIKTTRLNEIINLQHEISDTLNKAEQGKIHEVLVEGPSKRNKDEWMGRTKTNKVVIFPNENLVYSEGDVVTCKITRHTSATLFGEIAG
ncbi:MAG: tRNA (N6-isopentenyl adenosine(37)-C2)-methylthiotransferase MiaB [Candidatus Kapaibacterium sp.]